MSRAFAAVGSVALVGALLGACRQRHDEQLDRELAEREAYAKRILLENDAGRLLGVSSTSEIVFEEGFGPVTYLPPDSFRNHASRWIGQNAHVRLKAHPGKAMRIHVQGWLNEGVLRTRPQLSFFLDGVLLASRGPLEGAHYWIDVDVPADAQRRPWLDLNIRVNAVGYHWSDPPQLTVADIYNFGWTELP